MAEESTLALSKLEPIEQPPVWANILLKSLSQLKGELTLQQGDWRQSYGQGDGPMAELQIHDEGFYQSLIKGGSIGAAEAYMDGLWDSPDLTQVIELMAANIEYLDQLEAGTGWFSQLLLKLFHKGNQNSIVGSKRNIQAHYDLSNAFYELFLDSSMMYSSAVYENEQVNLECAAEYKLKKLCDALALNESDHLLEIGTGWGGLACYAAKQYGCKVTTTTISDAQYHYAQQWIEQEGLAQQITLLKQDYRQLKGSFDKLISIEMIEAVGYKHLATFFKQCSALLKPGGKMALQAITIACQREKIYRKRVDFIQRYIFPGGYLPSIQVLAEKIAKHSTFTIRQLDDIGLDYAQTLADWRANFEANREAVQQLGFDERFIRLWRYYLCYCEGGFRQKTISTVQMTLEKAAHY